MRQHLGPQGPLTVVCTVSPFFSWLRRSIARLCAARVLDEAARELDAGRGSREHSQLAHIEKLTSDLVQHAPSLPQLLCALLLGRGRGEQAAAFRDQVMHAEGCA
jgi:hypothetical protein